MVATSAPQSAEFMHKSECNHLAFSHEARENRAFLIRSAFDPAAILRKWLERPEMKEALHLAREIFDQPSLAHISDPFVASRQAGRFSHALFLLWVTMFLAGGSSESEES